jgi:hypothetical protein
MEQQMNTPDKPVTDEELEQFYGEVPEISADHAACNAIRAIHYIDFTPEVAQRILGVLAMKVDMSQWDISHAKKEYINDAIGAAFMELDV